MPYNQGYAPGMPGIGPSLTARGRMIWFGMAGIQYLPAGGVINSSLSRDPDNYLSATAGYGENETEPVGPVVTPGVSNVPLVPGTLTNYVNVLRAGLLMGKITTGGLYRPSIIGLTTAAVSAAPHTTITVTAQCATEIARLIAVAGTSISLTIVGYNTVGTAIAVEAITAVSATGTTLTISSFTPTGSGAYAAGAFICPADGSQYPVTFVDDQFGINVTDVYGNSLPMAGASGNAAFGAPFPRVAIAGGTVNVLNIVNYPTTVNTGYATLRSWIKGNLNSAGGTGASASNYGGRYSFTDDFGL